MRLRGELPNSTNPIQVSLLVCFYTDGSCSDATYHHTKRAAWAVVQYLGQPNQEPTADQFQVVQAAHLQGRQPSLEQNSMLSHGSLKSYLNRVIPVLCISTLTPNM